MKTTFKTMSDVNKFREENGSVEFHQLIIIIEKSASPHPERPSKPTLNKNHNSQQVKIYSSQMEEYEKDMVQYDECLKIYRKECSDIAFIIEQLIKDEACLESVPEKSRDKVYSKAWSDGHSSGFYQVYQELVELVDLFN
jgi:hypothetical protein